MKICWDTGKETGNYYLGLRVSKNRGTFFQVPIIRTVVLGSILGSQFGKLQFIRQLIWIIDAMVNISAGRMIACMNTLECMTSVISQVCLESNRGQA